MSEHSSSVSDARLEANRRNAGLSTGPRTEEGKAVSSRNNLRHGFTGAFCVLPHESNEEFEALYRDFMAEHDPQTITEKVLVTSLAQHHWLTQRALKFQESCMIFEYVDEAKLALYTRYLTQHQRAFHRCLNDLLRLRKTRLSAGRGFESQRNEEARRTLAETRARAVEARACASELRRQQRHSLDSELKQARIDLTRTRKQVLLAAHAPAPVLKSA